VQYGQFVMFSGENVVSKLFDVLIIAWERIDVDVDVDVEVAIDCGNSV